MQSDYKIIPNQKKSLGLERRRQQKQRVDSLQGKPAGFKKYSGYVSKLADELQNNTNVRKKDIIKENKKETEIPNGSKASTASRASHWDSKV